MHGISMRENREIPRAPVPWCQGRAARERPRPQALDERSWEVRRPRSTCEVAEQRRAKLGRGGGGGKGAGQGERGQ
jgi:hypothetical protein